LSLLVVFLDPALEKIHMADSRNYLSYTFSRQLLQRVVADQENLFKRDVWSP